MSSGMTINSINIVLILTLVTYLINPLEPYQWKNRVILIYSNDQEQMADQLDVFTSEKSGFLDRDLVVFSLNADSGVNPAENPLSEAEYKWLMKQYFTNMENFGVVLIGKDGGVKLESSVPVRTAKLFDLIDSMPMRIHEMKSGQ
ncbi:MAG: DUF4174 domain-containing protein [Bacteroidota bacterium]